jgi:subtilisin-like proprotein convertase family protein
VLTTPGIGAGSRALKIYDDDADAGILISDNPRDDQFVAMRSSVTAGAFVAFGKARAGTFPYSGLPQSIFDQTTITSDIIVPKSAGIIRDVNLAIAHTLDGDLDVSLTHLPSGKSLELFTDVGDTDAGFIIRLDDEGPFSIALANDPDDVAISGILQPEGPTKLSNFDGLDASGRWRLTITDDNQNDFGRLFAWSLGVTF